MRINLQDAPNDYDTDPFLVLNDSQSGRDGDRDRRRGGAELTGQMLSGGLTWPLSDITHFYPLIVLHVGIRYYYTDNITKPPRGDDL